MDDLASEWAGINTVAFVENDPFCQKVLHKHWSNVLIIGDVNDVTRETIEAIMADTKSNSTGQFEIESGNEKRKIDSRYRERLRSEFTGCGKDGTRIDIISGGFPCQPHSVAGKRKGSADERNLWPEFKRCIEIFNPGWVVAENVPGLFTSDRGHYFGTIISDLAALGYITTWFTLRASDTGAQHQRERLFIVGYSEHNGLNATEIGTGLMERVESGIGTKRPECSGKSQGTGELADTNELNIQGFRPTRQQVTGKEVETGLPGCSGAGCGEAIGQPKSELGRSTYDDPAELDIIRGVENEQTDNKKTISEIKELIGRILFYMWESRKIAQTSPDIYREGLYNCLPEMSRKSTYRGKWYLGERIEANSNLRDMWEQYYLSGWPPSQNLQSGLLQRIGEILRREEMEYTASHIVAGRGEQQHEWEPPRIATGIKDRAKRIKAIGNTNPPQMYYPIYKAIVEITQEKEKQNDNNY